MWAGSSSPANENWCIGCIMKLQILASGDCGCGLAGKQPAASKSKCLNRLQTIPTKRELLLCLSAAYLKRFSLKNQCRTERNLHADTPSSGSALLRDLFQRGGDGTPDAVARAKPSSQRAQLEGIPNGVPLQHPAACRTNGHGIFLTHAT